MRTTLFGQAVALLKFRTFKYNEDSSYKTVPRLTKFGRLLRKTGLDALPSILNVLSGKMSLVGLTTMPLSYFKDIDKNNQYLRIQSNHGIKPGLVSLYKVYSPNYFLEALKLNKEDLELVKKYDQFYINNSSFKLDLHILLRSMVLLMGFSTKISSNKISDNEILFPKEALENES